jgi:hypothetical protein
MFRKISIFVSLLALATAVMSVSADASTDGCFVDAPTTANEGVSIPVTVKCENIPITNNVFGFQFGTSLAGDYTTPAPTSYTAGEFTSAAVSGVLEGNNTLALYGVSRQIVDVVSVEDFTLGSYALTAKTNLTSADGSVGVTFVDATFKLSDNYGLPLTGWMRTVNDTTTTINDIDLAWLSGNMTVKSDSNALGNIANVDLNLGGKHYTASTVASYQTSLNMDSAYVYLENGSGNVIVDGILATNAAAAADSNDTLNIAVSADMWGHLNCSTSPVDLDDAGTAEDVDGFVGTSGAITLKAGDVDGLNGISNTDATIIAGDFGDTGAAINATYEGDINIDSTVNIFDLVHVGRNIDATTGTCS